MTGSGMKLFTEFTLGSLTLPNRVVMAPMTRKFSPGGVPGEDVASYYRRRAEAKVGLLITEGIYINPHAGPEIAVPNLYDPVARAGWRRVVAAVHGAGGRIFAQLWHIGLVKMSGPTINTSVSLEGPSGINAAGESVGKALDEREVAAVIEDYAACAAAAKVAGFDGIELHGAHGYLIDQFLWSRTNQRSDAYGGNLVERTRFAVEVVLACRRAVGPHFPISFRFSQWKIADYGARLADSPQELEMLLAPIADAGVTVFHCSTRRYWEPEFPNESPGDDRNLAGWTRELTGLPTITVGSVTLTTDVTNSKEAARPADLQRLEMMLKRGDFDLVAVGRALIANPDWVNLIQQGRWADLAPFKRGETDSVLI
jgi:2,4-dienoyl-CoA reductase-like NADH-dependent reductase (Old Yellow Enzyme family)